MESRLTSESVRVDVSRVRERIHLPHLSLRVKGVCHRPVEGSEVS